MGQGASPNGDRATAAEPVVSALRDGIPSEVEMIEVRYDPAYPTFGLRGEPVQHAQHPNQQKGLNLYVSVINFDTGEWCFKKLYENSRGLHFKHTGFSPMYLGNFTATAAVVPFQVLYAQAIEARSAKTAGLGPKDESAVHAPKTPQETNDE